MMGGNRYPAPSPQAHELGSVTVPYAEAGVIIRWLAPCKTTLRGAALFVRSITSATGAPVLLESWLNGQCMGSAPLAQGLNQVRQDIPLNALDLIEIKAVYRGETQGDTVLNDAWVLFNA